MIFKQGKFSVDEGYLDYWEYSTSNTVSKWVKLTGTTLRSVPAAYPRRTQ